MTYPRPTDPRRLMDCRPENHNTIHALISRGDQRSSTVRTSEHTFSGFSLSCHVPNCSPVATPVISDGSEASTTRPWGGSYLRGSPRRRETRGGSCVVTIVEGGNLTRCLPRRPLSGLAERERSGPANPGSTAT